MLLLSSIIEIGAWFFYYMVNEIAMLVPEVKLENSITLTHLSDKQISL